MEEAPPPGTGGVLGMMSGSKPIGVPDALLPDVLQMPFPPDACLACLFRCDFRYFRCVNRDCAPKAFVFEPLPRTL